jgi:putative drug exporter of the RND superfamily
MSPAGPGRRSGPCSSPALMHLSGNANWSLPRWLDHLIPHLNVEGAHHPAPAPAKPLMADATVPGSRD